MKDRLDELQNLIMDKMISSLTDDEQDINKHPTKEAEEDVLRILWLAERLKHVEALASLGKATQSMTGVTQEPWDVRAAIDLLMGVNKV